jgi:hypothetical protein
MTARERALAEAVANVLAGAGTPIEQSDALRDALNMPSEPDDITLFLVEDVPGPIHDLVAIVARLLGGEGAQREDMPNGAWTFPDMVRARTCAVIVSDVCATTKHTTPPIAVRFPSDRE